MTFVYTSPTRVGIPIHLGNIASVGSVGGGTFSGPDPVYTGYGDAVQCCNGMQVAKAAALAARHLMNDHYVMDPGGGITAAGTLVDAARGSRRISGRDRSCAL